MKIILTGSEGFVASALKERLEASDDIIYYPFDCCEEMQTWKPKWEQWVARIPKVDYIVHLGANSNSLSMDASIMDMNFEATRIIADYARETAIPLLFGSTLAAEKPHGLYGVSKLYAENYILRNLDPQMATILRFSNIFGDGAPRTGQPSIPLQIKRGDLKYVYKGCQRDFIHVEDVADIIETFLRKAEFMRKSLRGSHYEIGSGYSTSIAELVTHAGQSLKVVETPPHIPMGICADAFHWPPGIIPQIDVKEWVRL